MSTLTLGQDPHGTPSAPGDDSSTGSAPPPAAPCATAAVIAARDARAGRPAC